MKKKRRLEETNMELRNNWYKADKGNPCALRQLLRKKRRGPWSDWGERQRKEHDQQVHYAAVESTAF